MDFHNDIHFLLKLSDNFHKKPVMSCKCKQNKLYLRNFDPILFLFFEFVINRFKVFLKILC